MSNLGYSTAAVVFIDVLGTQNRTSFSDKHAIHRLFHEEIIINEARQKELPHVIYTRHLRSFSDYAYVIYPYKDGISEDRKSNLNLLYTCLLNTSLSILRLLQAGYLVRGGASVGNCYIDELGFFGSSVEQAYQLESKSAKYPRVLIDRTLGEEMGKWEESLIENMHPILRNAYTEFPRLVMQDFDGEYFLNIFFELEKTGNYWRGTKRTDLNEMKTIIFSNLDRDEIRFAGKDCILAKIAWMRSHTESARIRLKDEAGHGPTSFSFLSEL